MQPPSLNALGNAGDIRSPRRRQASSRNSLPALNAAAVVQVPQAVQCVFAQTGSCGTLEKEKVARVDGHKQAGFTPAVKRNARRTSPAGRTACFVQTGSCGTRKKKNVGRADGRQVAGIHFRR